MEFKRLLAKGLKVDDCLICDQGIYAADQDYVMFLHGYAHAPCVLFLRVQGDLARNPGKSLDT